MPVCIIGAGASGCLCAYFLIKNGIEVTLFDPKPPLVTLLPTGGGRCNLGNATYDIKELAKNYPRGEKFLYSVFSKFSTYDTVKVFNDIGVNTFIQDDGRIFPTAESSEFVRKKILNSIKKADFIKEKVKNISYINNGYKIVTTKSEYWFPKVIIATGGREHLDILNHKIIETKPSLVGLNADLKDLSGIVIKNVFCKNLKISGDILFTHFGISGPLTYKISSLYAYNEYPYNLILDVYNHQLNLQDLFNTNPHKDLKNILSLFLPERFAECISGEHSKVKAHNINGKTRDLISEKIHNFELKIIGTNKGEETVTAGGYDLNEINSKTMESKIHPNLYFIGEALNIDGFCGGFNLQNAWSTAYVASEGIKNQY